MTLYTEFILGSWNKGAPTIYRGLSSGNWIKNCTQRYLYFRELELRSSTVYRMLSCEGSRKEFSSE